MRKKPRAENAGLEFVPSAKRQKLNNHGGEASTGGEMLDKKSFDRHLTALGKDLKKVTTNKAAIKLLMSEMSPNRRHWVVNLGVIDFLLIRFVATSTARLILSFLSFVPSCRKDRTCKV